MIALRMIARCQQAYFDRSNLFSTPPSARIEINNEASHFTISRWKGSQIREYLFYVNLTCCDVEFMYKFLPEKFNHIENYFVENQI